jgi:hypothetical protein
MAERRCKMTIFYLRFLRFHLPHLEHRILKAKEKM